MKIHLIVLFIFLSVAISFAQALDGETISTQKGDLIIKPILHATMAMTWDGKTIYTDPYGGIESFAGIPKADLVLITDIHGDHMNINTLEALELQGTTIVAPQAVMDKLPAGFTNTVAIANGESKEIKGVMIEAIPMYNLPETEDSRHPKGRGNGYVLTLGGKRIYISGDTEDIQEMRKLKNIDAAFVCMNQPYTMTVEAAASAVLAFQPKVVYPFHYRGKGGFSDVAKFKQIVADGSSKIEVRLIEWYPSQ